ncbi:MAG TPA: hypothetical protein V6C88_19310, partial [Chroococcidiopsis sp.]
MTLTPPGFQDDLHSPQDSTLRGSPALPMKMLSPLAQNNQHSHAIALVDFIFLSLLSTISLVLTMAFFLAPFFSRRFYHSVTIKPTSRSNRSI